SKALKTLQPNDEHVITAESAYVRYVVPSIGEVVREAIAPHPANEINAEREAIIQSIHDEFAKAMRVGHRPLVNISALAFTNMDFPDALDRANEARAEQSIHMEKSIAERERLEAETTTAIKRRELREQEGQAEAAKIDAIGAALRRNPEYLQYQMQEMMPGIYEKAGANGNLIITAPNPNILVSPTPSKSGQ
ncbi:hypothetical protein KKE28_01460, partial [Patescibacteria group bacterium]|nr:hypothetical protein [Patescibacteria group bacterium]